MKSSSTPQSFIDIDANSSLVFSTFDIVCHIIYIVSLLFYLFDFKFGLCFIVMGRKKFVLQYFAVERKAFQPALRASRFVGEPVENTATDTNKNAEPAVTQASGNAIKQPI